MKYTVEYITGYDKQNESDQVYKKTMKKWTRSWEKETVTAENSHRNESLNKKSLCR